MAIKTPVFRDGRIVFSAEHFPLFRLAEVLDDALMDEIVQAVNLLPQLIQQLEQASQFIHELAVDEGYDDNPIVAQIDALVAKAKG